MSRSRLEQETTITYNREEDLARLWTANEVDKRAWQRVGLVVEPYGGGWRTTCPKTWVRIRRGRQLSETARAELVDRMKRCRGSQIVN